jgi:hypothetical protein
MEHLSDWHDFDSKDPSTYPKVDSPVQVRFVDGALADGAGQEFFSRAKILPECRITAWRYIKDKAMMR